ncbi:MAG: hypothetical protein EAZ53_07365 [Bacteroidetes bacterium]|nr:MAG: hypothetical protein EAZ53_07365 [Bacteroidota bacterium]
MLFNSLILFFLTFGAVLVTVFTPSVTQKNYKILLSFSGAYLFSITVIHILPELFSHSNATLYTGIFVLAGFYFQILIDYFSEGIEHGHIHHHAHAHSGRGTIMLYVSLFVHSLLEGSLLVHPHAHNHDGEVRHLLFGLMLHKIPEAFALTAVLLVDLGKKKWVLGLLFLYALASPFGVVLSDYMSENLNTNVEIFTYLFAFVAGNFLHISTTIFFESEPQNHTFKGSKLIVIALAGILAIGIELLM